MRECIMSGWVDGWTLLGSKMRFFVYYTIAVGGCGGPPAVASITFFLPPLLGLFLLHGHPVDALMVTPPWCSIGSLLKTGFDTKASTVLCLRCVRYDDSVAIHGATCFVIARSAA